MRYPLPPVVQAWRASWEHVIPFRPNHDNLGEGVDGERTTTATKGLAAINSHLSLTGAALIPALRSWDWAFRVSAGLAWAGSP
jgi:hypothetical protein